jgi:hypothetical protein
VISWAGRAWLISAFSCGRFGIFPTPFLVSTFADFQSRQALRKFEQIEAIGFKVGNQLFIHGEEAEL